MTDPESPWTTGGVGGVSERVRSRLERTAREVASEWGLRLGPPFGAARYSYAAPAGDDVVLKVVPAEDDEADHEAEGLAFWDGHGAVRLLRRDDARRAFLIQRAVPGTDASGLPEDEATRIGVEIGTLLWRRALRGRPFRWIGDHVPRWLAGAPDHPVVRAAREIYGSMTVGDATLLHGDFHHHNLLRHTDHWLAIDPKPYAGEAEYDVAPFLWNPVGSLVTRECTERRIAAFAAAGLDSERIRKWTIVRGAHLAFPLAKGETEKTSPQLQAVRLIL